VAALHLLVDSYDPLLPIAMQLRPERGFDALQSNQPSQRDGNRERGCTALPSQALPRWRLQRRELMPACRSPGV
jgi:hypothetical protein